MQFALQALPFSRHAQNDMRFGHRMPAPGAAAPGAGTPAAGTPAAAISEACASGGANDRAACSLPCAPSSLRLIAVSRLPPRPPVARNGVRILRNEGQSREGAGGRLLISGRMADVCAALNRMAFNEYACG